MTSLYKKYFTWASLLKIKMIKVLQINPKLLNQTQVSHTRKDIGKKHNKNVFVVKTMPLTSTRLRRLFQQIIL